MAIFKKLFGKTPKTKLGLVKEMVKRRVESDPFLQAMIPDVIALSEIELMALPEATITTIVETHELLTCKQGLSPCF